MSYLVLPFISQSLSFIIAYKVFHVQTLKDTHTNIHIYIYVFFSWIVHTETILSNAKVNRGRKKADYRVTHHLGNHYCQILK